MSGNNRVYYACLGVKNCKSSGAYQGVISGAISLNRGISNIFKRASSSPVATYGGMPDVEFVYKSYLSSSQFIELKDEPGLNDHVGFDLLIGSDTAPLLTSAPSIRASYMLLTNITYSMPVDSFFTVQRTYKGFSKGVGSLGSISSSSAVVPMRQFYVSGAPQELVGALQNIEISIAINRTFIPQFATRKPYASVINFPIETSATFEALAQGPDGYVMDAIYSACQNPKSYRTNLNINLCNGSIPLSKAYLTSLKYNGGEANSNSNLTIDVTYTSYSSPEEIKPVIYFDNNDPCD